IKVGGEEFSQADDDFSVGETPVSTHNDRLEDVGNTGSLDNSNAADGWGTPSGSLPDQFGKSESNLPNNPSGNSNNDSWGAADSWGSPTNNLPDSSGVGNSDFPPLGGAASSSSGWDDIDGGAAVSGVGGNVAGNDGEWAPVNTVAPSNDPWGDSDAVAAAPAATMALKEADFDEMVKQFAPDEWAWACMKVNSPDIHSVWFIVTKGLANVLARNMYAGEDFQLDNQLIRDLIAELTNVLGGKLMLLLEEMGGKFTLTVPEIGFGLPELPDEGYENAVCKVVVDGEHPVIVALCFNPGGIKATGK
ncbi:MAG: hypothetical protein LBQ66_16715, partial [Planctomycetaceae bacterium]|nr:hypothetical protein [Planctomycetaceae bacterium]